MAHFAQLDENNQVSQIIVVSNDDCGNLPFPESEAVGIAFCELLFGPETVWKQTSYNSNFRQRYACIGGYYIPEIDAFTIPQPYPSWTLNRTTGDWDAPVPQPEVPDGYVLNWDEVGQEWDLTLYRGIA
jgi:hypothetical protein